MKFLLPVASSLLLLLQAQLSLAQNNIVLNPGQNVVVGGDNAASCIFCEGKIYNDAPIIKFSSGNDAVSCAGLMDLIAAGMFPEFCETERPAIEDACCYEMPPTSAPPTMTPTRALRQPRTPPPTSSPTTKSPTNSPTASPTAEATDAPTQSPTISPMDAPTGSPTTKSPTESPTVSPTRTPSASTAPPSMAPTNPPVALPATDSPTSSPVKSVFPKEEEEAAEGAVVAAESSGSRDRTVWTTKLLVGAMVWSSLVGWLC